MFVFIQHWISLLHLDTLFLSKEPLARDGYDRIIHRILCLYIILSFKPPLFPSLSLVSLLSAPIKVLSNAYLSLFSLTCFKQTVYIHSLTILRCSTLLILQQYSLLMKFSFSPHVTIYLTCLTIITILRG